MCTVQPVERFARVPTKDLSLVPAAALPGTWRYKVRVGGMPWPWTGAVLNLACGPLGRRQCKQDWLSSLSLILTSFSSPNHYKFLSPNFYGSLRHKSKHQPTRPLLGWSLAASSSFLKDSNLGALWSTIYLYSVLCLEINILFMIPSNMIRLHNQKPW